MQMEILIQIAGSIVAIALYFLPAIVADRHGRRDKLTIALFNALFGWTVVGWLMTLYWAFQPNPATDLVGSVMLKRRNISMRTFSAGLVERVQRRVVAQKQWAEKQGTSR
ncbi:superinfection immunity protein [Burkholderia alba]|uniref:superinfection immunity protein n=1 Tax=Burkholderia alba TaxID=2683677 RepID=UPI002B056D32|nr:superinfection immunity protein [Burkholderia alba]